MKQLFAVIKNEFIRYFISPLAYVYLIAFMLLNASFAIYFGGFIDRGVADLTPLFAYQPWLYLFFIPGIAMRLWSEEFKTNTIMQIITMPVPVKSLVWGKFFASWLFAAIGLVLTFPFWITVNILGNPDNMVILTGYLGSFMLAGSYLAISQTMSSLTKNQVIALVLAGLVNLIFVLSGVEFVLNLFRGWAPELLVETVASFSFITHFESIISGLIELRDVIFFVSVAVLFNMITIMIIKLKSVELTSLIGFRGKNKKYALMIILFFVLFYGVNIFSNNMFRNHRIDFTEEKIYSLSNATIKTLENIKEPVEVRLYYSSELGKKNPKFRIFYDRIKLLLKQYAERANGKLKYAIYNPKEFSDVEDKAIANGIQAIPIVTENKKAFFGMSVVNAVDEKQIIPFLNLERKDYIEQDLTKAIYLLQHKKQKKVALISSLPMAKTIDYNVAKADWQVIKNIKEYFDLKALGSKEEIPSDIDVLMVVHPLDLSTKRIEEIRSYVNNGGNLLLFMDVAAEAKYLISPVKKPLETSTLNGIEKDWGFKFHGETVVADLDRSMIVDSTEDYQSNVMITNDVIQHKIDDSAFNKLDRVVSSLKKMSISSVGSIEPLIAKNIEYTPLILSSKNSALMPSSVVINRLNPAEIIRHFKSSNIEKILAAKFVGKDENKKFKVIVVADSDLLHDDYWVKTKYMFDKNLAIPLLDNANFVINSLEYLAGVDGLTELRGKTAKARPFKLIEDLRKRANLEFKAKEEQLLKQYSDQRSQLQALWNHKEFKNKEIFTKAELEVINDARRKLEKTRTELRKLRLNLTEEINHISLIIKFYNIYAISILIIVFWAVFGIYKRVKLAANISHINEEKIRTKFKLDSYMGKMIFYSILVVVIAVFSILMVDSGKIDKYENKAVFTSLSNDINKIDNIVISDNKSEVTLYRKDNLWKIKDRESFYVKQDKVRNYLSELINARYYEKKSANPENLHLFGLTPVGAKGSIAIGVKLYSGDKELNSFVLGYRDIEIGRGGLASYFRFEKQFQAWSVEADFSKVSANWKDWCYSTVWDIDFGRFMGINDSHEPNEIVAIAKNLATTKLVKSLEKPKDISVKQSYKLSLEKDDVVIVNIYEKDSKKYADYEFKVMASKEMKLFAEFVKDKYYLIK